MPKSLFTAIFALTALDILLVYMTYSHVNIFLTWFLVPILSLLFCDKIIFCYSVCLNYVLMFTTTWLTAAYQVALRDDYVDSVAYFRDVMGGYTIETVILSISAYMIGKLTEDHYRELFRQYGRIKSHEKEMGEKMKLLESMVEIYDNVNYINFIDSTEMSLRDDMNTKHGIDNLSPLTITYIFLKSPFLYPIDTAVVIAFLSAQIVAPYEAFSTLTPGINFPSFVSIIAETLNFEYGA